MKCNDHFCPWVKHSQERDRYMCLKCGLERNFYETNGFYILLLCIVIALFITLMTGFNRTQDNPRIQPSQVSSENLH